MRSSHIAETYLRLFPKIIKIADRVAVGQEGFGWINWIVGRQLKFIF